ncbi:hypothetical protein MKW94_009718 [Papaver nudicaule]|uniref:Uncharacterized protein n=2 Tax=Papaver nudicaule TaxID=74823 RepID=A0AA42B2H8_PAPNU|nr:hypothetical protein [Papaver nudicaule]
MAMASFQRFSSQISRTPSLKSIIRSTTTTSSSTSSKKVSDRIVKLFAIDYKGQKREIIGLSGHTLLKALTNNGLIDPSSHRLEDIDACFFFPLSLYFQKSDPQTGFHSHKSMLNPNPISKSEPPYQHKSHKSMLNPNPISRSSCFVLKSKENANLVLDTA